MSQQLSYFCQNFIVLPEDNLPAILPVVETSLTGSITTTPAGYSKLLRFYSQCKDLRHCKVELSFQYLNWIDANMVAILQGILLKLKLENRLEFVAILAQGSNNFNILFSNGFFTDTQGLNEIVHTGTAVKLREFQSSDEDEFVNYVENDLLDHKGLNITTNSKEIIIQSLIEIFANYDLHSKTDYPLFVCGQFYPKLETLKFTIFDLGIGFLLPIKKVEPHISSYESAIDWALVHGNSTKEGGVPGGCGLSDLKTDLLTNNGNLEIISGDAYKICSVYNGKEIATCSKLKYDNVGTAINLFFNGI